LHGQTPLEFAAFGNVARNLGRADDSSVVRAVLIQNEKVFAIYAASQDLEWSRITSEP